MIVHIGHGVANPPNIKIQFQSYIEFPSAEHVPLQREAPFKQVAITRQRRFISFSADGQRTSADSEPVGAASKANPGVQLPKSKPTTANHDR